MEQIEEYPWANVDTMPESQQCEIAVLSCVLQDPSLITVARSSGLSTESFYHTANIFIWEYVVKIYAEHGSVDEILLGEKLLADKKLSAAGGWIYINEVAGAVDTTSRFNHYVESLLEMETQRSALLLTKEFGEQLQKKQLKSAADIHAKLTDIARQVGDKLGMAGNIDTGKSLVDFVKPSNDDETCLLGKNRYLCRGGGMVLVGQSGIGKSSSILQASSEWALGRDFMGIVAKRPMKILVIQAEDDDGDIGEVWHSLKHSMYYTDEQLAQIRQNVVIVKDKVNYGEKFLSILPEYLRQHEPDLCVINPFLSYFGGDISRQQEVSAFLRNGLNRINSNERVAWVLVHHTNKPPQEKPKEKNYNEYMYNMAGSAEVVNWARCVVTLESTKMDGTYMLRLAKRGKRAGITRNVGSEFRPKTEIKTKIYMRHATGKIEADGEEIQEIKWVKVDDADIEEAKEESEEESNGRPSKVDPDEVLAAVPIGEKRAATSNKIKTAHADIAGADKPASSRTWRRYIKSLLDQGKIKQTDEKKYYREEQPTQEEVDL